MTNRDTVIVSPTGSGKTLAYLMPMLALLSDDLLDDDILLHLTRFQSKQATRSQVG
jgi:superfamily II DNA/RNA helicase